jgi:hypothetical protein
MEGPLHSEAPLESFHEAPAPRFAVVAFSGDRPHHIVSTWPSESMAQRQANFGNGGPPGPYHYRALEVTHQLLVQIPE